VKIKKFLVRNDGFICLVCGKENFPAEKTCRDHCCFCLYSLHVDKNPGDRLAHCDGFMKPIRIITKGSQPVSIFYECEKCKYTHKNKIAEDDDRNAIFALFSESAKFFIPPKN